MNYFYPRRNEGRILHYYCNFVRVKMDVMEEKNREKQIYRVTIVGSIANFGLLVFKFVAGILG